MLRSRINSLAYRFLLRAVPQRFIDIQLPELYPRELLARIFLSGEGIEIGALNHRFPIPPGARVRYVDRAPLEELRKAFPNMPVVPPDVIDDGETLATFGDSSLDFVIASHIVEHTQDPIGTLKNFFRVLRPGGIAIVALPDKRFSFDINRPVTPWEHLLRDHVEGPEWSKRPAFEEVVRVILGITDPDQVRHYADIAIREAGHTHYHVWTQTEMLDMLARLKRLIDFEVEVFVSNPKRGEGLMVLRKGERGKDGAMARESLELMYRTYAARFPEFRPGSVDAGDPGAGR